MKPFFAGLPTEIDVRALVEAFGVPADGDVIRYDAVADVIKCPVKSSRWKTVTDAWRRKLWKLHNVVMRAGDGQFAVMPPDARVDHGGDRLRRGFRQFSKAHSVVASTDLSGLSDEMRAQADHVKNITTTAIQAARAEARRVKPRI